MKLTIDRIDSSTGKVIESDGHKFTLLSDRLEYQDFSHLKSTDNELALEEDLFLDINCVVLKSSIKGLEITYNQKEEYYELSVVSDKFIFVVSVLDRKQGMEIYKKFYSGLFSE